MWLLCRSVYDMLCPWTLSCYVYWAMSRFLCKDTALDKLSLILCSQLKTLWRFEMNYSAANSCATAAAIAESCNAAVGWMTEKSFYVRLSCKTEVQMLILGSLCRKGEVLHNSLTSNECFWFSLSRWFTLYETGWIPRWPAQSLQGQRFELERRNHSWSASYKGKCRAEPRAEFNFVV